MHTSSIHRRALAITACLGLALALGGCGSGSRSTAQVDDLDRYDTWHRHGSPGWYMRDFGPPPAPPAEPAPAPATNPWRPERGTWPTVANGTRIGDRAVPAAGGITRERAKPNGVAIR